MLKSKTDSLLTIDLAPDAIRVLDVRVRHGVPTVTSFASAEVPGGTPETLPERHLVALGDVIARNHLKSRSCIAAMPTTMVVTRSLQVDYTKDQTTDEQIQHTLKNCLTFDSQDLVYDYWPITELAATGRPKDILVVATQASVVKRYLAGFEKLKLSCTHIDVAPCAVASLIRGNAGNPDAMVGTVAIAKNTGFFAISEKGKVLFWRPFELPVARGGIQGSLDRVGDEITKCVSHMVGSLQFDNISEMLVYGHGSDDASVTDYLKNRFHLPVRNPSPFEALPASSMSGELRESIQANVATHYCTAVGLAMQPSGV